MKIEGHLFSFHALFFIPVTVIYWLLSKDPTGTTALVLTIGLAAMVGYYLLFTARRMEARPEDRGDAEISEGSGEIGFFPPHSWWPIGLAAAFATVGYGLIFGPFLVVIGFGISSSWPRASSSSTTWARTGPRARRCPPWRPWASSPTSVHKFLGD